MDQQIPRRNSKRFNTVMLAIAALVIAVVVVVGAPYVEKMLRGQTTASAQTEKPASQGGEVSFQDKTAQPPAAETPKPSNDWATYVPKKGE